MRISKTSCFALAIGMVAIGNVVHAQNATESERAAAAAAHSEKEVGISSHDGISISGEDVIVTRNGISEKLTKPLVLDNGTRVHPDGVIITRDDQKVRLRPLQILTFDGRFLNFPVRESVPSSPTTRTETTKPAEEQPLTKEAAEEVARQEAARRARAANEVEKAGR